MKSEIIRTVKVYVYLYFNAIWVVLKSCVLMKMICVVVLWTLPHSDYILFWQ